MKSHHSLDPHQTLGAIIQEMVADFPSKPYGQILTQPKLRRYLFSSIIVRLGWTYPWCDEVDASTLSPEFRAQLFHIHLESAIYWSLEDIIQKNLDIPQTA